MYSMPFPENYKNETLHVVSDALFADPLVHALFADPLVHAMFTLPPDLIDY